MQVLKSVNIKIMRKILLMVSCSFSLLLTGQNVNSAQSKMEEIPEDMELSFDALLEQWMSDKMKPDTCEFEKQPAVVFADSTYIRRLYNLPTTMELAYNDIVKRFIEMYAGRRRGQVSYMLALGEYYFPMFEAALEKENLPLELKYLPIIESALNPFARSRAGASGLWQFMPGTGKMYKLEINSLVDERRDPQKATLAAVNYLRDMYNVYGDWNLVIAAYNCGPGNVNKAIKRSGGKKDYWDIYPYLPKETRGYVPAFIAATYIMNFYTEHQICPSEVTMPLLVDTIGIDKMLHFQQVADMLNVPVEQVRLLNPQYKSDIVPGGNKKYSLKLPLNNLTAFISKEDDIFNYKKDELFTHKKIRDVVAASHGGGGYAQYRVKRGDTLGSIALKHGLSVGKLKKMNALTSDKLSIGMNLKVSDYVAPAKSTSTTSNHLASNTQRVSDVEFVVVDGILKKKTKVTSEAEKHYTVVTGDTWNGIVKKTGASIANIKRWNNIKGNNIIAGKTIKILTSETQYKYEDIEKPEAVIFDKQDLLDVMSSYVEGLTSSRDELFFNGFLGVDDGVEEIIDDEDGLNSEEERDEVIYHQLILGEPLSTVAEKYDVTVDDLIEWNQLDGRQGYHMTKIRVSDPDKTI